MFGFFLLTISQPEDPLQSIIEWLREPEHVPHIFIMGPPGAGKHSIASLVSDKCGAVHISATELQVHST